jgi:hypothetical protein
LNRDTADDLALELAIFQRLVPKNGELPVS